MSTVIFHLYATCPVDVEKNYVGDSRTIVISAAWMFESDTV